MTVVRTTRVSRAEGARKRSWTPPNNLDAPVPPEGYKYRYVRASLFGDNHDANVYNRIRQGYEVVNRGELPESQQQVDYVEGGRHQGAVRSGDLILMKVPESTADERNAFYAEQTRRMIEAVDSEVQSNNNPLMPLTKTSKSTVTHGNRNTPTSVTAVDDDDD